MKEGASKSKQDKEGNTRRIRQPRESSGLENQMTQMTQRIVPVIVKNILNAYIILTGAFAAVNGVRAVPASLRFAV
jgi:hypothetical protein